MKGSFLFLFGGTLSHKKVLNFPRASASIEVTGFLLLTGHITLIGGYMLNHPCVPGINPTWSPCLVFVLVVSLICC